MPLLRFFASLLIAISLSTAAQTATGQDLAPQNHLNDARSLYSAGHWDDAAHAFKRAYNLAPEHSEIRAASALEWSSLLWEQGHYPQAETLVIEAIELAKRLKLDHAVGQLLLTLGHIEASKGELSAAENTLNICVQLTGEIPDETFRALCRLNRRMVRTLLGHDPGPAAEFQADLSVLRETTSPLTVGTSLEKTAELYRDAQDLGRAQTLLDEAQRLYQTTGSVPAMTRNQLRQVQLLHRRGEFAEAAPQLATLQARFDAMGNRPLLIQVLALQAEQALHTKDHQQAVNLYRRAISLARAIGNPQLQGRAELALCELSFAESLQYCQRAAETFQATEMRLLQIRALTGIAQAHQQDSHYEEARSAYRKAIAMLEPTGTNSAPHDITRTLQLANLCQVETRLQATGALATCQSALTGFDSIPKEVQEQNILLRAAATFAAGRAATAEGRGTTALNYLQEASELYLSSDEPNHLLAAEALLNLGHLQSRMEAHKSKAPSSFERSLELIPLPSSQPKNALPLRSIRISLLTQLAQHHLSAEAWSSASDLLITLKDEALAVEDYKSVAWAFLGQASVLLQTGAREEAIDALRQGLAYAERAQDDSLIQHLTANLQRLDAL